MNESLQTGDSSAYGGPKSQSFTRVSLYTSFKWSRGLCFKKSAHGKNVCVCVTRAKSKVLNTPNRSIKP